MTNNNYFDQWNNFLANCLDATKANNVGQQSIKTANEFAQSCAEVWNKQTQWANQSAVNAFNAFENATGNAQQSQTIERQAQYCQDAIESWAAITNKVTEASLAVAAEANNAVNRCVDATLSEIKNASKQSANTNKKKAA